MASTSFAWERWGRFGGRLILDFVNTIEDEGKTREVSGLPDWRTTLRWAVWAEALTAEEAAALAAAEEAFAPLHAFKEAAWRVLSAEAAGAEATRDGADWAALLAGIAEARATARLGAVDGGYAWRIPVTSAGGATLRARLALDLERLLTGGDLGRLRECGRCTGLYLDTGRGSGRRWCRMKTCGNRAKVERFRSKS